jgi:8-oxo-dGTP pyrophosphatase MutT (NUDIX family)
MSDSDGTPSLIARRTSRVIVIDGRGRFLLLAVRDAVDGHIGWFMPGGAIEEGETVEEAARRELAEELGIGEAPGLAGPAWISHYRFTWNGHQVEQEESFFILRLARELAVRPGPHVDADGSSFEARWVTIAELAGLRDVIGPADLVHRLTGLLDG